MNILLVEPYFTGSHQQWATAFAAHSTHHIDILSLKGQFWKWRMHGGAVTLARLYLQEEYRPDLIIATDMLDLTTFLSLTRKKTAGIPIVLYFHENQLVYPWSATDRDVAQKRDRHYGFINFTSALTADHVLFNSAFNMNSFLDELPRFLGHFPDYRELDAIDSIRQKSAVLHLGLNLHRFDAFKAEKDNGSPILLWNHRWEHDKNPEQFFKALFELDDKGIDFRLILLGENFRNKPQEFDRAAERFQNRILKMGYAETLTDYAKWLKMADILPVTSLHDFFGASVVEAMYCGCTPLLPQRLSYPELLQNTHPELFYETPDEFVVKLERMILEKKSINCKALMQRFDWENLIPVYDNVLGEYL